MNSFGSVADFPTSIGRVREERSARLPLLPRCNLKSGSGDRSFHGSGQAVEASHFALRQKRWRRTRRTSKPRQGLKPVPSSSHEGAR